MSQLRNDTFHGERFNASWIYIVIYSFLTMVVLALTTADVSAASVAIEGSDEPIVLVCPAEIKYGDIIECSIDAPAETDRYEFTASAGDRIQVIMTDMGDMASGIEVRKNGVEVEGCSAWGSSTAVIDNCLLPDNGRYHIFAFDYWGRDQTGQYFLSLNNLTDPTDSRSIDFGEIVADSITLPTQTKSYHFSAGRGDLVQLVMTDSGEMASGVEVRKDGVEVEDCSAWGSSTAVIDNCLIPDNGRYHIFTYDYWGRDQTGSYELSLNCLTPRCGGESSLVLIYAVLDNNLGDDPENWERLVNNAEEGMHDGVRVRLLVDGPGTNDVYLYDLVADNRPNCPSRSNPTCNGTYVQGQNFWRWEDENSVDPRENSAHPEQIYAFVNDAVAAYPDTPTVALSLVGHGAGWTANALPGQPSKWGSQPGDPPNHEERVGGLLWDDNPGGNGTSRSMSTKALGVAMGWIRDEIGKPIDLLYLDACSMGMAEIAGEIGDSADYLLASPNTAWASFAYDDMLQATNGQMSGQQIGRAWLKAEADALDDERYPYTLSLIDLGRLETLQTTSSTLADALANADTGKLSQAFAAADHYESDYDGAIETSDTYVDLKSFAVQIRQAFSGNTNIVSAADALSTMVGSVIVETRFRNGKPWMYEGQQWRWNAPGGLSVYLPLAQDEVKRSLYTPGNLQWAKNTSWDEFLTAFWDRQPAAADALADELPTCESTRDCEPLAEQLELEVFTVFFPTVQGAP